MGRGVSRNVLSRVEMSLWGVGMSLRDLGSGLRRLATVRCVFGMGLRGLGTVLLETKMALFPFSKARPHVGTSRLEART
jgi:hypothetical protein